MIIIMHLCGIGGSINTTNTKNIKDLVIGDTLFKVTRLLWETFVSRIPITSIEPSKDADILLINGYEVECWKSISYCGGVNYIITPYSSTFASSKHHYCYFSDEEKAYEYYRTTQDLISKEYKTERSYNINNRERYF